MADFRKWLLAFAVVALFLSTGISVQAQSGTTGSVACTVATSTPLVRGEGYTELTGDIVIDCVGGTPVAAGGRVPQYDITIGLNTNITSRLYGTPALGTPSEARLLIDNAGEPGATLPYVLCTNIATSPAGCAITGTGGGANPYSAAGAATAYQGLYQPQGATTGPGAISGHNAVAFLGVPIDAPSTALHRILRITNIRADATQFNIFGSTGGGNAIPIVAFVSIAGVTNGAPTINITQTSPDVAFVVPGLLTRSIAGISTVQCSPHGGPLGVTLSENFAYAFKTRQSPTVPGTGTPNQLFAGESGFTPATIGTGTGETHTNVGLADSGTRFLLTFRNLQAGVTVTLPGSFTNAGGTLVLTRVPDADSNGAGGAPSATAGSVVGAFNETSHNTATNASATYEVTKSDPTIPESITLNMPVAFAAFNVSTNRPFVTAPGAPADLLSKNNFTSLFTVSLAPANVPGESGWNTAQNDFAATGADHSWIPRFVYTEKTGNLVQITSCTCNLLYPYVTAQNGYDTGITIANTSMDPFGGFSTANSVANNAGQVGAVQFFFFGNSSVGTTNTPVFSVPEPGASVKTLVVPPGCTLAFDLKGNFSTAPSGFTGALPSLTLPGCAAANTATGGNAANNFLINGTATATPTQGFTGYVIATATFQYCHGEAFIIGGGAGGGAFYNAIELDTPFWAGSIGAAAGRTGQYGESQGN